MNNEKPADIGLFDTKGHWTPSGPKKKVPLFQWPIKPLESIRYIFKWGGLIWPINIICVGLAYLSFYIFQPELSQCKTLHVGWISIILLRNFIYLWVVYGSLHYILYIKKLHGSNRKYHPKWQAKNNKRFTFKNQVLDNILWSNASGLTIWTAYEVGYLWAAANGKVPYLNWKDNPIWFVLFFFIIIFFRDVHFYFVHRLLHVKPIFKHVHSLHHRNNNVGPWSGLSMHPIEHLLYMSGVLIHFVIPSNPVHFLFHTIHLALTPVSGHTGFEGPLFEGKLPVGSFSHYLHHKYVTQLSHYKNKSEP